MGKDHTIYSLIDGVVKFEIKDKNKKKYLFTQLRKLENKFIFLKGCMLLHHFFFILNIYFKVKSF